MFSLSGEEKKGNIIVTVKGLKIEGTVYLTLFDKAEGFPSQRKKAIMYRIKKVKSKSMKIVFDSVKYGSYAIALWHDQNDNKKLDKNFIGIPKEGFGVSRDAKGSMGPPKFKDAVFKHDKAKNGQTINVKY
jgi:uncharacterized protein (DUF2141 family)